jgi:uncharacterized protein (DUF1800 family)
VDDREKISWLGRRAAFGLAPGALDRLAVSGPDAYLDILVDPGANRVAVSPDPFAGLTATNEATTRREEALALADRWLDHMLVTPRPLEEVMTWFWHDHFAVSLAVVKASQPMARHVSLLRTHALGNFRELVEQVSIDPAMLLFLDGATSTSVAPNENFARELLELYTVGIGNFTEADVHAAAAALTGWVVRQREGYVAELVRARHNATPQPFFGTKVTDVVSVVDAAVRSPACPTFIAAKLAAWFLGPDHDANLVPELAKTFVDNDLAIAPLVRAVLRAGLDGRGGALVLAPVPWFIAARRALDVPIDNRVAYRYLAGAGQAPLAPPNVGGWPGPSAWLGSSATAMRVSLASALVDQLTTAQPTLQIAAAGDLASLAKLFSLPHGFNAATTDALRAFAATKPAGRAGAALAVVALSSPDLLVA